MFCIRVPEVNSLQEKIISFMIVESRRNGDCLFDSLCGFLHKHNRIYKRLPSSSHDLRLKIVDFVAQNWNKFFDDVKVNLPT